MLMPFIIVKLLILVGCVEAHTLHRRPLLWAGAFAAAAGILRLINLWGGEIRPAGFLIMTALSIAFSLGWFLLLERFRDSFGWGLVLPLGVFVVIP